MKQYKQFTIEFVKHKLPIRENSQNIQQSSTVVLSIMFIYIDISS